MRKTGYLVLENGKVFKGERFGADKETMAEIVFTTGMTGYLCTLSDPSYNGQMVVQTFPMIGNYGVIPSDFESNRFALAAYIVREICETPSNFRAEGTLDDLLKKEGIPGISDIDTRALTKILRSSGVMNAAILNELPTNLNEVLDKLKALPFHPAVKEVTCDASSTHGDGDRHVVMMDFGAKKSIVDKLVNRGCKVTLVPSDTKAEVILAMKPDGVLLSNGPGDPQDNPDIIETIKRLKAASVPIFGICLGHQLMALSQGAKTTKLKYGHRGANQPAKDLKTGKSYMTSQNHGFTIELDHLPENARLRFVNGNDGTCEGLDYLDSPAFSVQFHPEASGGPLDTMFLFDRFIDMMGGKKECR